MIEKSGKINGISGFTPPGQHPAGKPAGEGTSSRGEDLFTRTGAAENNVTYTSRPELLQKEQAGETPGPTGPQAPDPGEVPADWVTTKAQHGGNALEIKHPPGWNVTNLKDAIFVASPADRNAIMSFIWTDGLGPMDPQSLINNVAAYFKLQQYTPIQTTPVQSFDNGVVKLSSMTQDAKYVNQEEPCMSHTQSLVTTSNNPFNPYWSGSLLWAQAPEGKWQDYRGTLALIAANMTAVKAQT